jgi:hydroxymethylpyrimidine kinase/phosphomethylpyrimidine kinase
MRHILVIAGSDSGGGAGIQADIKTIAGLGAHALTVLTAVTAQNSLGITGVHKVPAKFISRQIDTIMADLTPHAVKIGMLYTRAAVKAVARMVKRHNLSNVVLDPVLVASSGGSLMESEGIPVLKDLLFPLARVVTPNLYEAGVFAQEKVGTLEEAFSAARMIHALGPHVVITGGHLESRCVDLLYDGRDFHQFSDSKIDTIHTHGSGCVFSAALATFLSYEKDVKEATKLAHDFARRAIMKVYACGRGAGAVQSVLGSES